MRAPGVLFLIAVAGCVDTNAVVCGDITCPADTTCQDVGGKNHCATADELSACKGVAEDGACTTNRISNGVCHSGVCFAAFCGNGLIEPLEQCDDGNQISGDGCSGDCTSKETCGNGVTDPLLGEQCDDGNLLNGDGCDSRCLPEQALWRQVDTGRMQQVAGTPALYPAMVYDQARGVTLMFGGTDATGTLLDDTWLWNGTGWSKASPANRPSPRYGCAITYDANRKRVVLFGGQTAQGVVSETWEWDGSNWMLIPTSAQPLAAKWAAMAYDTRQKRVLLFGGVNRDVSAPPVLNQGVWAWDGAAWESLLAIRGVGPAEADHPVPRIHTTMAFDAKRGKLVVYGGRGVVDPVLNTFDYLPETWEYDSTPQSGGWNDGYWTLVSTTPPKVGSTAIVDELALAWDPASERVVMLGGKDSSATTYGASFAWNGSAWSRLPDPTSIVPRANAALASDTTRKRVVAWGGESNRITQEWNGTLNRWDDVTPSPMTSIGESIAVDTRRGRAVMFDATGMTREFDGYAWQVTATSGPPARPGAALAFDAQRDEVVLFGGGNTSTDYADTWIYKGGSWQQRAVSGPSGRHGAGMVYDAGRKQVVLFGGIDSAGARSGETWTWDGTAWTLASASGPDGRAYVGIAYDPDLDRVVMYGGGYANASGGSYDGNVFLWDGATWTMVPLTAGPRPGPRIGAAMTWDPAIHRVVVYGGQAGYTLAGTTAVYTLLQDTWLWDGTGWNGTELKPPGGWTLLSTNQLPANRFGAALFVEPRGRGLTLFGGHTSDLAADDFHDTWQLRWHGAIPEEVCRDAAADDDGDGKTSCADEDCWAYCAPDCPPGTSCAAPGCGDGTCNTWLETNLLCPQDCPVPATVCGDFHCDPGETCVADCP